MFGIVKKIRPCSNRNLVIIIHLARNTKPENQMNANDIEDIVTMLPEQLKYSYRNELFLLGTFVVWYF